MKLKEIQMNREELLEWQKHPVTIEFFKDLQQMKGDLMEAWSNGAFTGKDIEETSQLNSRALGKVQQLADLLEGEWNE
jgi:hypothetical protein